MKWKDTKEGRVAIYYIAIDIVDELGTNAYIHNEDAKDTDVQKIIDYLKNLIITEWVGD